MRRAVALGLFALAGACTFGGLAEYEIGECDPLRIKDEDPCDDLNKGDDQSCSAYRCNSATRRCAKLPRDDDRDGIPSGACGGTDCDDKEPRKHPGHLEECDLIDNDCNGLADDGVAAKAPTVVWSMGEQVDDSQIVGESSTDVLGVWVGKSAGGGKCLFTVRLPAGTGGTDCSLLSTESNLEPRQPHARPLAGGIGALMLKTLGCATGELIYRFAGSGLKGAASLGCQGAGAALPAIALASSDQQAIAAYYEVSYLARKDDPVQGCPVAAPAPLMVAFLDGAKTSAPVLAQPQMLAPAATSVRRPALLALGGQTLLASPSGANVGLWLLEPGNGSVNTLAETTIPELAGARAVSVGARPNGNGVEVAVAAEIGCSPERIALALVQLDTQEAKFGPVAFVQVAAAGSGPATGTSVAWQQDPAEWMVAWTVAGPAARVRRVRADAQLLGDTFDVPGFSEARAAVNGDLLLQKAIPQGTGSTKREFWFVRGACSDQ